MTIADGGMMGTAGNTTANQNSLACTTSTAGCNRGDVVLVAVAVDNRASGGGDDLSVSGVADDAGNTYAKARQEATNLAAQAGSSVSLWWCQVQNALSTSSVVTATFTTNTTSDAQVMAVRKFTVSPGSTVQMVGTAGTTSTTTNPGSLDVTTANLPHYRVRAIGSELDSSQALTVTAGGWAAWTEIASSTAGTTAEQVLEVEFLVSTGTGAASAPTLGTNSDNASVYVAFVERPYIAPPEVYYPILTQ